MATELTGSVEVIRVDELLEVDPSKIRNKKLLTDLFSDVKSGKVSIEELEKVLIHNNFSGLNQDDFQHITQTQKSALHNRNTDNKIETVISSSTIADNSGSISGTGTNPTQSISFTAAVSKIMTSIELSLDINPVAVNDCVVDIIENPTASQILAATSDTLLQAFDNRTTGITLVNSILNEIELATPFPIVSGNNYLIVIYSAADTFLAGKLDIKLNLTSTFETYVARANPSGFDVIVFDSGTNNSYFKILSAAIDVVIDTSSGKATVNDAEIYTLDNDSNLSKLDQENIYAENQVFKKNIIIGEDIPPLSVIHSKSTANELTMESDKTAIFLDTVVAKYTVRTNESSAGGVGEFASLRWVAPLSWTDEVNVNGELDLVIYLTTTNAGVQYYKEVARFNHTGGFQSDGDIIHANDNVNNFGSASNRAAEIFSVNDVINTSDGREKTEVISFSQDEKNAALEIKSKIGKYQWLESVNENGSDNARFHIGITVQEVISIMQKHNLDVFDNYDQDNNKIEGVNSRYAFICFNNWDEIMVDHPEQIKKIPLMEFIKVSEKYIEIINGKHIEKNRIIETERQKIEEIEIFNQDGKLLRIEKQPLFTEEITEAYTEEIQKKGDRYSIREGQLALFITAASS